VDDIGAEGRFRVTAVGGPSGFARVGLQARTTQSGTWREAGLYIDTPTNPSLPSRVGVAADQFVVFGGSSVASPFSVTAGLVEFTGSLQSTNFVPGVSGIRIDGNTGVIEAREVIQREALAPGAVTDIVLPDGGEIEGEYALSAAGTWTQVLNIVLSDTQLSQHWDVRTCVEMQYVVQTVQYNGISYTVSWRPWARFRYRVRKNAGNPWSDYRNLEEAAEVNLASWIEWFAAHAFKGKYNAVQYFCELFVSRSVQPSTPQLPMSATPPPVTFRDIGLSAKITVK
jgi:hypothetical protein